MKTQTSISVQEGQSGRLSFTLRDEDNEPVAKADLDSLTLNLYLLTVDPTQTTAPYYLRPVGLPSASSLVGMTTINDREDQDVLDANGVTMGDTSGVVTWEWTAEDVPFLGTDEGARQEETHIAHFRAVWDGGTKSVGHEFLMRVRNVRRYAVE